MVLAASKLHQSLLKDVARSFYLSLRVLPCDVRPVMSLGYLLCRAADTIADSPTAALDEKKKLLTQLKTLFAAFPIPKEGLLEFLQDLEKANLTPKTGEKKLLAHFDDCSSWFNALDHTDQSLLQAVVTSVITGMEMDLAVFGNAGADAPRALSTEKELETYIHWIGGEPGRFWTNVCLAHWPRLDIPNKDQFLQDGIVFGTGLQMVNILRDLPADLKIGRCYIPQELLDKHGLTAQDLIARNKEDVFLTLYIDLIDQTMFRLGRGLSYLKQLPRYAFGMRAAVTWPLLIGGRTLHRLRETPSILRQTEPVKVKRGEIYRMVFKSLFLMPSTRLIRREFEKEA